STGTGPSHNLPLPLRRLRRLALRDTPLQLRSPPSAARVVSVARRERLFVRRKSSFGPVEVGVRCETAQALLDVRQFRCTFHAGPLLRDGCPLTSVDGNR